MPMEAHVEFIMVNYDQTRGVDSLTVQSETADSATVLARSKLGSGSLLLYAYRSS
jgi:hypothetical protein